MSEEFLWNITHFQLEVIIKASVKPQILATITPIISIYF